jgi:hypothetical protein
LYMSFAGLVKLNHAEQINQIPCLHSLVENIIKVHRPVNVFSPEMNPVK